MDPNSTIEGMLQQYVSSMIKQKNDENADEGAMIEQLSTAIDDAMLEALPDESLEKMMDLDRQNMLDEESYEQIVKESGVDQNAVVLKAMTEFRDNYLNGKEA